jgi:hypothetical protein
MTTIEAVLIGAAFALVVVLWVVLYPRPRLQLNERGFLDRDLGLGWIGWDEIEGAYPPNVQDAEGLRLRVRPGARLLRWLRRRNVLNQYQRTCLKKAHKIRSFPETEK